MIFKSKKSTYKYTISKFYFIDDLIDSLKRTSISNNLPYSPVVDYVNYKHHSEIYDIFIVQEEQKKSLLKLFDKFYLLVVPESEKIKIYISPKEKSSQGYYEIENHMNELKKFFLKEVNFIQIKAHTQAKEIIFMD